MDRFIETGIILSLLEHSYLKSNMDRFIVLSVSMTDFLQRHLKSNMDRFIEPIIMS